MCWTRPRSNLNMWFGLSHSHQQNYKTHLHIQTSETYSNNTTTHTLDTLANVSGIFCVCSLLQEINRSKRNKLRFDPPTWYCIWNTLWCVTFRFNNNTHKKKNTCVAVISPTGNTKPFNWISDFKLQVYSLWECLLCTDQISKWQFSYNKTAECIKKNESI